MNKLISTYRRFVRSLLVDTIGANMVEYLVVVGLVALAASAGFSEFGKNTTDAIKAQGGQVTKLGGGGGGQ
jgi:pilus assembly protein Flp/PilA